MIRRPPRSTPLYSSAASDVYKRQALHGAEVECVGGVVCVAAGKPCDVSPREQSQCARVSRTTDLPPDRTQRPGGALHVSLPASRASLHRLVVRQAVRRSVSTARRVLCDNRSITTSHNHCSFHLTSPHLTSSQLTSFGTCGMLAPRAVCSACVNFFLEQNDLRICWTNFHQFSPI